MMDTRLRSYRKELSWLIQNLCTSSTRWSSQLLWFIMHLFFESKKAMFRSDCSCKKYVVITTCDYTYFLLYSKEWGLEKETKVNPWFLMMKHSEITWFFHLHFTWLFVSWHPQRILKNIHFENNTAVFLLRCQNWLRREISLICH